MPSQHLQLRWIPVESNVLVVAVVASAVGTAVAASAVRHCCRVERKDIEHYQKVHPKVL